MNNKAFTLIELLTAVGCSVLLLTGAYSFLNASSQVYTSGITAQSLQNGATTILSKIMQGSAEPGANAPIRLSTSASCMIPNNDYSTLYFCQDNPNNFACGPFNATVRWYSLDPSATKILYHHPTTNPLGYDVIYSAPEGSTITLRFSYAAVATNPTSVVEVDVGLSQTVAPSVTNSRVAATGSASTFILLRNHP